MSWLRLDGTPLSGTSAPADTTMLDSTSAMDRCRNDEEICLEKAMCRWTQLLSSRQELLSKIGALAHVARADKYVLPNIVVRHSSPTNWDQLGIKLQATRDSQMLEEAIFFILYRLGTFGGPGYDKTMRSKTYIVDELSSIYPYWHYEMLLKYVRAAVVLIEAYINSPETSLLDMPQGEVVEG